MSARLVRECIKAGLSEFPPDAYPPGWLEWQGLDLNSCAVYRYHERGRGRWGSTSEERLWVGDEYDDAHGRTVVARGRHQATEGATHIVVYIGDEQREEIPL